MGVQTQREQSVAIYRQLILIVITNKTTKQNSQNAEPGPATSPDAREIPPGREL